MSARPARFPGATYRLQFNSSFGFSSARAIVPYLRALGISHCYASPLFLARADSTHGYDGCDFGKLSPALGGSEQFEEFVRALHEHGMGLILDFAPNHMACDLANPWWRDVLEWGTRSRFATWFDIDWQPAKSDLRDKVLLPVLEDHLGTVLEAGKLKLAFQDGSFTVNYYDNAFPVAPASYAFILKAALESLATQPGDTKAELALRELTARLKESLEAVSSSNAASNPAPHDAQFNPDFNGLQNELNDLHRHSKNVARALDAALIDFNGMAGRPATFDRLFQLLQQQHYRLAFWRVASEEINYRRFFDVTSLVALRMEFPEVFQSSHALLLDLLRHGKVDGLRIDHPDGLYDPNAYFTRLQESYARVRLAGAGTVSPAHPPHDPLYVVVEKILMRDEPLPEEWPVHGATGYEFLNLLNGLFIDSRHEAQLTHIYKEFSGRDKSFASIVYAAKKRIVEKSLASEVTALTHRLKAVAVQGRVSQDFTFSQLRHALSEVLAVFPVYRTYITEQTRPVAPHEQQWIELACRKAGEHSTDLDLPVIAFLHDILLLNFPRDLSEEGRRDARQFVLKFQQLTSPVMAKGLEDTAFYRYFRLCSLNEVGGDPGSFGTTVDRFHQANEQRAVKWPHTLLATATHDTKRGEDVRARINVLSEIPADWKKAVERWRDLNAPLKSVPGNKPAPDANDEYLLYQTLVGAWIELTSESGWTTFRGRMVEYMLKAIREAKQNTSWTEPNVAYEQATQKFVEAILHPAPSRFIEDFAEFQSLVAFFGRINSLSQLVLKIASPGVPDFYQGTELWDLSLVDPDNRRPVNYEERQQALSSLETGRSELQEDLDANSKLLVMQRALRFRKAQPDLFAKGDYLPVEVTGQYAQHVCAFARKLLHEVVLVVIPRLSCTLMKKQPKLPLGCIWEDTSLVLPFRTPPLQNIFTDRTIKPAIDGASLSLKLSDVLVDFPVALLASP